MNQRDDHRMDRACDMFDYESINIEYIDLVIKMLEGSIHRLSLIERRLKIMHDIMSLHSKIRKCFTWNRGSKT